MTNAFIAILVAFVCAICTWSFALLLCSEPDPPTDAEVAKIDARLRTDFRKADPDAAGVIGISEVSQIRLMPFPRILPGFQVSPHPFGAVTGIVGACLLLGSLLWCLFVPRTTAVNTQWTDAPAPRSPEPPSILIQMEDGSCEEFDFTAPSDETTNPNPKDRFNKPWNSSGDKPGS